MLTYNLKRHMENRIIDIEQVLMDLEDYALILLNAGGKVASWNAGAERTHGYTDKEAKGESFEIFFTGADRAAGLPARLLEDACAKGRAQNEGWCVGKDEDKFWSNIVITVIKEVDGKVIGYLVIVHDLSERTAAEKAIHEYEGYLQEMAVKSDKLKNIYQVFISEIRDYAITMIDQNGFILDWNPGSEKIKGYTYDEIIGKNFSIFYSAEDKSNLVPESLLLKASKEGKAEHEGWRVKKDGSRFWAHVIIIPMYDKDGIARGFVKITKDLTAWVLREQALKERVAELEHELATLKKKHVMH